MSQDKIRLISVTGPTASGKTALSVELAVLFGGEVVSADSMQIYKNMDIATAKPTTEEMRNIPHHLMGFLDACDTYSVAQYVQDASAAISDITLRGKIPVLVGGTGLYVDSLLNGIEFSEGEVDFELRKKLMNEAEQRGVEALLAKLEQVDPQSAQRLSEQKNIKRIVRALEIYYTTGVTMTQQNILSKQKESVYAPVKIALKFRDRQKLYDRINKRVDIMMDMGLLSEAQEYFSMPLSSTSRQAIGYKELKPYFDGDKSLDECIEALKQSTRRYAKRQLTWFNRDESINWFYPDDYTCYDELINNVRDFLVTKGFELI